ncbi:MAG TPA: hypothetical protein VFC67_12035 [Prolixibacteraceae bacterium]|nr:hypothetical protein [Prolixibacteraceae bacterium]
MKKNVIIYQTLTLLMLFVLFFEFVSCNSKIDKKSLIFRDYPNLKIGFSTQNFQKAMPVNVESLSEIIKYASNEGYQFIELRDNLANLTNADCKILADVAMKNKIEVIYEIHKNLLDSGYIEVFNRGLVNTMLLPGPGIMRTLVSKSEFDYDATKKGWNRDELTQLIKLSDSCTLIARGKNIQFVVENLNESFFGDGKSYYGLADLLSGSPGVGLQLDISNPFRKSSREIADPEKVIEYLSTLGNRWVISHLKTVPILGGEPQPYLTDNPLAIEKVVEMMGKQNVLYVALELAPVADKQQCFDNHAKSIRFLIDRGVLKK